MARGTAWEPPQGYPPAMNDRQAGTRGGGVPRMLASSVLFTLMALAVGRAHAVEPGLSTAAASLLRSGVNLALLVVWTRGAPALLVGDLTPVRDATGRVVARPLLPLLVRGLSGGVALMTYFASISLLSAGEAAFLNQTSAAWTALLGPYVVGEPTGLAGWVVVGGSLVGVLLLAHPRAGVDDAAGRTLGLVSGLSAAIAYLSIRRAAQQPPTVIVAWFTATSTVLASAWMLATGAHLPTTPSAWGWLTLAGVAATVAQILMTQAYHRGRLALIAAAGATSPMLTALGGWALLGQAPDRAGMVGMGVLAVFGMVVPFMRERREARAGAGS